MPTLIDGDTIIVPGHGIASNKRGLTQYLAKIKTVESNVQGNIQQGQILEQVVADTCIGAEFDYYYGNLTMDGGGFRK